MTKNICLLALLFACSTALFAQSSPKYSRVEIKLDGKDIHTLTRLGIETDHGIHAPGKSLITEISETELDLVHNAGFQTRTHIADLKQHYLDRLQNPSANNRNAPCATNQVSPYPTPQNYTYGSMGGYHTLNEMMAVIDDMRAKFPNLISARADASDTISTWEGRKIQYVRISQNPDTDEAEPEVLYTSLIHCREPNSASQMMFFMWYLLENYDSDPEIQYILNNSELYFVPCINPDGYVFNETTDPQGGGLWRKNRRDNGNGTMGVDLNRNYGYFWGNDDSGSSPNTSSNTYRGPAPFSEPETRTIRDFVRAHDFQFVHNYHTFSNLLIYPWAYNNQLADPSLAIFAKLFTRENGYKVGTTVETVGYNVNGSSDDWIFAETGAQTFTPEVGLTGFWPEFNEIDDLNRENMWQNLATALCALRFGEISDQSPQNFSTLWPTLNLEMIRYGYKDGPLSVTVTPISSNILSVTPTTQVFDLAQFDTQILETGLSLDPAIQIGDAFQMLLTYSNGSYSVSDTLTKFFGGKTQVLLEETGSDLSQWSASTDWDVTESTFVSAPQSITDSPLGDYISLAFSELQTTGPGFAIPANALNPQVRFWAKWAIEPAYDMVQVHAISTSNNQALCGRHTRLGSGIGTQPKLEPIYDGFQNEWVEECLSLSDFIGQTIQLRFVLISDNIEEFDGYYFDDLRIEYIDPTLLSTQILPAQGFQLLQNQPNPAHDFTQIKWEKWEGIGPNGELRVLNALGETMWIGAVNLASQSAISLQTARWPAGLYTFFIQTPEGNSVPRKMTVIH